jgi:hypothetical protein
MKKLLIRLVVTTSCLFSVPSFAHGGGGYWFPGFVTGAVIGGAIVNSYHPYPYPYAYYPYQPVYAQPPVYIQQPAISQAPTSYNAPNASAVNTAPEPSSNNWYYCQKTKSYYPYVNTCASGWKIVPSTPPDITAK